MDKVNSLFCLLRFYLSKLFKVKGHGISIIVPLSLTSPDDQRAKNWKWLSEYWKSHLPGAEIVIGTDTPKDGVPFSKSVAVNDGVNKAHGDVLVIIDADAYISSESILQCAAEIRLARKHEHKLWFVPYRKLFRLTRQMSEKILESDPKFPLPVPSDVTKITNVGKFKETPVWKIGHWYGAMVQIMPREAFEVVGGWDPRFRGWGGEDHAAMVAMDTLYSPHKTLPTPVAHLWHPVVLPGNIDDSASKRRLWANQDAESTNDKLSGRYYWSKGHKRRMRRLVDEYKHEHCHRHRHHHHKHHHCPPNSV